jgi:hypothetical protein
LEIVTANQLAGNLLGWDLTIEFGQWMNVLVLLHVSSRGPDHSEEPFIVDGREMWLSLQEQVHSGAAQTREDRRTTKRWLKFSKKERKKLGKRLSRDEIESPFQAAGFSEPEIRIWILRGEWPAWTTALVRGQDEHPSEE